MKTSSFTRLSKVSLLAAATIVLASPAYAYGPRNLYKSPVLTTSELQARCPTMFEGGSYGPRQMRQISTKCLTAASGDKDNPLLMWSSYGPRSHLVPIKDRGE